MWKDFGARINEMKKVNQFEKKLFYHKLYQES